MTLAAEEEQEDQREEERKEEDLMEDEKVLDLLCSVIATLLLVDTIMRGQGFPPEADISPDFSDVIYNAIPDISSDPPDITYSVISEF